MRSIINTINTTLKDIGNDVDFHSAIYEMLARFRDMGVIKINKDAGGLVTVKITDAFLAFANPYLQDSKLQPQV
jgi:hypothetical protein